MCRHPDLGSVMMLVRPVNSITTSIVNAENWSSSRFCAYSSLLDLLLKEITLLEIHGEFSITQPNNMNGWHKSGIWDRGSVF